MIELTAPVEIPLACRQGSPFNYVLQFFQDQAGLLPVDFTGYQIDMHIREGVADSGAPIIMKLSSVASSADDARIFFIGAATDGTPDIAAAADPTNGFVYLRLLSGETALIRASKPPKQRTYPVVSSFFYDIEVTPPSGEPFALAYGAFDVTLEVTRA